MESYAPYLRTERTTRSVMGDVCLALLPALAGGVYFFGLRALWTALVSAVVCVLSEFVFQKLARQPVTAADGSALVTGLLLAMNLPATVPFWAVAVAGVFAIVVVKQLFGGIGSNIANPALMGRLFLMTVWPASVLQAPIPRTLPADAFTSATVLNAAKAGTESGYSLWQMFIGEIPGALGETSKLLLLVGFGYLCLRGLVNAGAAAVYIGSVVLLTFVFGPDGLFTGSILQNLLSGSLILGGCFMLTDYQFVSRRGRLLCALAAGIVTAGFRCFSAYPEGVCFGILTANCLAGLISLIESRHIYGKTAKNGRNGS
ncbi:MAG TPA: RnfABCDGE type electron transport complex subunit D [Candidatus Merdivicinus faecavium]|nr:RnfABCDGE type electron transport complex subunit D [Candidatus Merdivicinus faecavium]